MKNRIRVATLLLKDDKLLLVKHVDKTGFEWWVPPGGGLEGGETVLECAKREVFEETGLIVKIEKLAYVRQFISFENNNLELFFIGKVISGSETMKNLKGLDDEHSIKELRYFTQKEFKNLTVFPEDLKSQFWKDKKKDFPTSFLGVQEKVVTSNEDYRVFEKRRNSK